MRSGYIFLGFLLILAMFYYTWLERDLLALGLAVAAGLCFHASAVCTADRM